MKSNKKILSLCLAFGMLGVTYGAAPKDAKGNNNRGGTNNAPTLAAGCSPATETINMSFRIYNDRRKCRFYFFTQFMQ